MRDPVFSLDDERIRAAADLRVRAMAHAVRMQGQPLPQSEQSRTTGMSGTFVPPARLVQAAKKTAEEIRGSASTGADEALAQSWETFAEHIKQDALNGGYWQ